MNSFVFLISSYDWIHGSLLLCYPVWCWSHLSTAFACCVLPLEHVFFMASFFSAHSKDVFCLCGLTGHSILASWTCLLKPTERSHGSCLDIRPLRHMGHCCSCCLDLLAFWSHHSWTSGLFLLNSLLVRRISPAYVEAWKFWLKALRDCSLVRWWVGSLSDFALWCSSVTQNRLIMECLCWAFWQMAFHLGFFSNG